MIASLYYIYTQTVTQSNDDDDDIIDYCTYSALSGSTFRVCAHSFQIEDRMIRVELVRCLKRVV